jgi:hypothetical protein
LQIRRARSSKVEKHNISTFLVYITFFSSIATVAMAAPPRQSPAERLDVDGWRGVLWFLNGNEIAMIRCVSKALWSASGKAGVWASAISTVKLPETLAYEEIHKWHLPGKHMVLKGPELHESDDGNNIVFNTVFNAVIRTAIFDDTICPNLQSLTLLQFPATVDVISSLFQTLRSRIEEKSKSQLKRLVLELRWFGGEESWSCMVELTKGLTNSLPEEVEFRWTRVSAFDREMHPNYRGVILDLLDRDKSTTKFTLPGCILVYNYSDRHLCLDLGKNTTVQSLTFTAPPTSGFFEYNNQSNYRIDCLAKMLVHPSLRHLSIADLVIPPASQSIYIYSRACFTVLFFADPGSFSKSTLETLHIELGDGNPKGLLAVLHCVADMPNLKKFSVSWPSGLWSTPKQISMELLREFLKSSPLQEKYKERYEYIYDQHEQYNPVSWTTLSTLFM